MFAKRVMAAVVLSITVALSQSSPALSEDTVETGVNRPGGDYKDFEMEPSIAGFAPCQSKCQSEPDCRAWTFVRAGVQGPNAHCWLKNTVPAAVNSECCTSGLSGDVAGIEYDTNRVGKDYRDFPIGTPDLRTQPELICRDACQKEGDHCRAWTYVRPDQPGGKAHCWLKTASPPPQADSCCISGRNLFKKVTKLGTHPSTGAGGVPPEWADMLDAHNAKRKLHCAPPLTWSDKLAAEAQAWANDCKNAHSGTADGENLAFWVPSASNDQAFQNTWYCEVKHYDFDNPQVVGGFKNGCDPPVNGHFTQVVWKSSREIGCGKANCSINGQDGVYWVCRYSPPGNFNADNPDVLRSEVQRPGSCGQGFKANSNAEPAAGAGDVQTASVVQDADVYDSPGGNGQQTGFVKAGSKVKLLGCENNWCHVQGKRVPQGEGYVYNGEDFRSLEF